MNKYRILIQKTAPILFLVLTLFAATAVSAKPTQLPRAIVDVAWLFKHLDSVLVLDVRMDTESFSKRRGVANTGPFNPCGITKLVKKSPLFGHIPGSVLVPWQQVLLDREIDGQLLGKMLPDRETFQELMRRSGVNNDSVVVISSRGMDNFDMAMATRLYWSMKYYGHDKVAILNGGTSEWRAKKRRIRFYSQPPQRGNFTVREERRDLLANTADIDQAAADNSQQLVDSREADYFEGLTRMEGMVSENGQGSIPGSLNIPFMKLLDQSGGGVAIHKTIPLLDVARETQVSLNKPTIFYCNFGVQGSVGWFVWRELLGVKNSRLYDGSMHVWSKDPKHQADGF